MTKPKPKMTVVPIIMPTTYELVYWPDGCSEVPTFKQLIDTVAVVDTVMDMLSNEEEVPEDLHKAVVSWMLFNDINKFENAIVEARKHQKLIDRCVTDNIVFPFPLSKYKGGH